MSNDYICHRLIIKGEILIPQTFHIGSGESSLQTDAPIQRDKGGKPHIPGTTIAGLMRSTARDFAPYLLPNGLEIIDDLFGAVKKNGDNTKSNASRIFIEDAILIENTISDAMEVRDHVGIDRNSGSARKNLKYDKEVAPSVTSYSLEISIEKPNSNDLRILLDVLDFWSAFDFTFHIGGRSTTGLGRAKLEKHLEFYKLDFGNPDVLIDYLIGGEPKQEYIPVKPTKRCDIEKLAVSALEVPNVMDDKKPYPEAFLSQHIVMGIALIPQEPLLIQGSIPEIPDAEGQNIGPYRSSDADFVTAITVQK
ncbi:hypothetical protein GF312_01935, partial [Candidatus Poribacteria bacterium]|nr:hypothetical protein [Candidatus Poribacteria bacterium]